MVPPHQRESGFYSRCFIVPKKDGWYAYHFRSASVEPLSQQTKVKYAQTVVSQIRSEDWFVTIDLKGIHPYLHPSHSQGVPEVCFLGRSLPISGSSLRPSTLTPHFYKVCGCSVRSAVATRHPYTQLHRKINDWLILAQSEQMSRCCSRSHKSVGVKTEVCFLYYREPLILVWYGVGFDHKMLSM